MLSELPPWQRLFLSIGAGCLVLHLGIRVFDTRIELFTGLSTFNLKWAMVMFVMPFVSGVVVSLLYGLGGKIICYFPPLIVHALSYADTLYLSGVPQGASLTPLGWWGFFVVIVIESAAIGGVFGEIWLKKTYGRKSIVNPADDSRHDPFADRH
ncbi:MAG: hypothetical protein D6698_06090 [Gammaproteobacteria bacterium]|nr:MAG: hypothetical protein D6698_06090 [Gammaproteobacteria bacterium]